MRILLQQFCFVSLCAFIFSAQGLRAARAVALHCTSSDNLTTRLRCVHRTHTQVSAVVSQGLSVSIALLDVTKLHWVRNFRFMINFVSFLYPYFLVLSNVLYEFAYAMAYHICAFSAVDYYQSISPADYDPVNLRRKLKWECEDVQEKSN